MLEHYQDCEKFFRTTFVVKLVQDKINTKSLSVCAEKKNKALTKIKQDDC